MTIQVTSVLTDPVGVGISGAIIRVVALANGGTLPLVEASIKTGSSGEYDFNLLNGKYSIELLQTDTYNKIAYVEVTEATTTPTTLEDLIDGYAFCEVEAPSCGEEEIVNG